MIEQYAININKIEKADKLSNIIHILSKEKADRIKRFHFEKDKVRAIVGEALVRYLLIKNYNISNSDIRFGYRDKGKPYFISPDDKIDFNISHAGSWVVCAVGDSKIGIDVELIQEKEIEFVKYVFTAQEYNYWLTLPKEEQRNYFYQLWTMKESYSKYLGIGLGLQFNKVSFESLCNGYYTIYNDKNCVLYSQQFDRDYYLSVCVDKDKKRGIDSQVKCIDICDLYKILLE